MLLCVVLGAHEQGPPQAFLLGAEGVHLTTMVIGPVPRDCWYVQHLFTAIFARSDSV